MTKVKLSLALFIALLFTAIVITSSAIVSYAENSELDELADALEKSDWVPVIVWLKDNEFTSPAYQKDLDKKRFEIDKVQDSVLTLLTEHDFKLKYRDEVTNGFVGLVSKSGFEKLRAHPQVVTIFIDKEATLFLAQSRPLINAHVVERDLGVNGSGVTVCVLDSGVNYTHPDLGGCFGPNCKVVDGFDFCNGFAPPEPPPFPVFPCFGPNDPDPVDEHGHGTNVAGIIASTSAEYRGIAPGVKLAAVKVGNANGTTTLGAVQSGIDWCVNKSSTYNIKVITMSLGTLYVAYPFGTCDWRINPAIQNALNANIFMAAASGNSGSTIGIGYPACAPGVTSVGATYDADLGRQQWCTFPFLNICLAECTDETTNADKIACLTNRDQRLDLLAPGAWIMAPGLRFLYNGYAGTSQAAPHVAGTAALLLSKNQNILPSQVENILKASPARIFDPNTSLTFPRVDAFSAIQSLPSISFSGSPEIGRAIAINISDPIDPYATYILAMALGSTPGIPLGDGRVIPLNPDLLFLLSLQNPLSLGLRNSIGTLNEQGQGFASWDILNITELAGVTVYLAFSTINPILPFPRTITSISTVLSISLRQQILSNTLIIKNATLPTPRYRISCVENSATHKIYCFSPDTVEYNPYKDRVVVRNVTSPVPADASCVENSATHKIYCFGGGDAHYPGAACLYCEDLLPSLSNRIVEYNPLAGNSIVKDTLLPFRATVLSCAEDSSTNRIYCFGGIRMSNYTVVRQECPDCWGRTGRRWFNTYNLTYATDQIIEYNPSTDSIRIKNTTLSYSRYYQWANDYCEENSETHKIYCFLDRPVYEYNPVTDSLVIKNATLPFPPFLGALSCAENSETHKIYCLGLSAIILEYNPMNDTLQIKNSTLPGTLRFAYPCDENSATHKVYCFGGFNFGPSHYGATDQILEYTP